MNVSKIVGKYTRVELRCLYEMDEILIQFERLNTTSLRRFIIGTVGHQRLRDG